MKVKELIEMLSQMDGEAEVRFRDTYWENEGYGTNADNFWRLTRTIYGMNEVEREDGQTVVVLY